MRTVNQSECWRVYSPDNAKCLDCGENDKTLKQYIRCKEMYEYQQILKNEKRKEMYKMRQILKNAGLTSESINCISRSNQLIDVALLAEEDKVNHVGLLAISGLSFPHSSHKSQLKPQTLFIKIWEVSLGFSLKMLTRAYKI